MKFHCTLSMAFIVAFLFTACGFDNTQQAVVSTATTLQKATTRPLNTASATATPTPEPTFTATITPTDTPRPTSTPTIIPTDTPRPTSTSTEIESVERFIDPLKNLYSLVPPEGWNSGELPLAFGVYVPAFYAPKADDHSISMGLILAHNPEDMYANADIWKETQKQKLPDLIEIREDQLVADEGTDYIRWEIETEYNHAVFYFFASEGLNLVIIYDRPKDRGSENDKLVDRSIKTVRLGAETR